MGRLAPAPALLVALLGIVVVALLDHLTGVQLSFSVFYLLPIAFATWVAGWPAGVALALLSAVVWRWIEIQGGLVYDAPMLGVWNAFVRLAFFVVVAALLARLRDQQQQLAALARTDALTGLVSRGRFLELLEREADRARRYRHPLTVAYLDLDDFKAVNDRRGHAEGDRLLVRVAQAMTASVRRVDVAARLGGDEFALVLPETDEAQARAVVARLREELTARSRAAGLEVAASIGVASFVEVPDDPEAIVRHVDELMYRVKRAGKGEARFETVTGTGSDPPVSDREVGGFQ